MAVEQKYTQEGFRKLQEEYEYLTKVRMEEIKVAIAEARSFGDLSENAEYDEAKNEQTKCYTRIKELEELIQHAIVVDEGEETITVTFRLIGATKSSQPVDFSEAPGEYYGSEYQNWIKTTTYQMDAGSTVYNSVKNQKERLGRILQMHANKRQELDKVYSGDIAAAVGFTKFSSFFSKFISII